MRTPIKIVTSTAVPFDIENIDTDQIIPARFLKGTSKEGFGENLFRDWRYNSDGRQRDNFPLNDNRFAGEILIAGKNFGCGSSREHAAWAIRDYGFQIVVSSFFADIFKNNAMNNGLLPVQVSPQFLTKLFTSIDKRPKQEITVNLPRQTIFFEVGSEKFEENFDINPYKKSCLEQGVDDIEYLLGIKNEIEKFEEDSTKL